MKTDDLINLLSTNVEPVKSGQLRNTLLVALSVGAAAAVCLTLVAFGAPENKLGGEQLGLWILAFSFGLGLITAGTSYLLRAARPGKPSRGPLVIVGLLFFAILAAGIVTLITSDSARRENMVFGSQWSACLLCVPLFAIVPFASLIWALRQEATTTPAWTGAIAGLVAGALGAVVYTLHHPVSSVPFIMFWYGGSILVCALVGAWLGPRLLRW